MLRSVREKLGLLVRGQPMNMSTGSEHFVPLFQPIKQGACPSHRIDQLGITAYMLGLRNMSLANMMDSSQLKLCNYEGRHSAQPAPKSPQREN